MDVEVSRFLAAMEHLVNTDSERQRFKANPQPYLSDYGLDSFTNGHLHQASTVITITTQSNAKKRP